MCKGGERKSYAFGEINEHLRDKHGIAPDDQVIEGWNDELERRWEDYLADKENEA